MPGPAPAKVQHWALRLTRATGIDHVPVWDEGAGTWTLLVEEKTECNDLVHFLLKETDGNERHDCTEGHMIRVVLAFRRGPWRQGMRPWKLNARVQMDDVFDGPFDPNKIMALLAKPTKPQGQGKASGESAGVVKEQMNVKKTTVIRV